MTEEAIKTKINTISRSRQVALNRLQEIYDYGQNNTEDPYFAVNFNARVQFLDAIYEEFQSFHHEIVTLIQSDKVFEDQDKIRLQADKYFYGIKGKRLELDSQLANITIPIPQPQSGCSGTGAKLPKINIPIFDGGDVKLWQAFYDLYNSIIHNNNTITNIEKFHYLITSLKGDALNIVKTIPMTENNYSIAYDALINRYQNKRYLATMYFNELYTAQSLQRGTAKDIRHLLDVFSENLAALKNLDFKTDSWDFVIFNIFLQKLDAKTRTDFELEVSTIELPTLQDLVTFLKNHCKALESAQCMMPVSSHKSKYNELSYNTNRRTHSSNVLLNVTNEHSQSTSTCPACPANHSLYRCSIFLAKTPRERYNFVKSQKLCVNCIRSSHSVKNCNSSSRCKVCNSSHHTLLHWGSDQPESGAHPNSTTNQPTLNSSQGAISRPSTSFSPPLEGNPCASLQCSTSLTSFRPSTVLLSTAIIDIQDSVGRFHSVRVLLDTASMVNFISEKCASRLGLRRYHKSIPLEGINDSMSLSNRGNTSCLIKPCGETSPTFAFEAIILPKICSDQPKVMVQVNEWSHIKNLHLADANFHIPGAIDLLLGAELVPHILGPGRVLGKPGQAVALETVFGWVLQGKVEAVLEDNPTPLLSCHISMTPQLDSILHKFWETEQCPTKQDYQSPEDARCEEIYKSLVYRTSLGRFVVPLPFKCSNPDFGDTYCQALRRFTYLEARLSKNLLLYNNYALFIAEYLKKGYISEVSQTDTRSLSAYYLPHHCVVKPDSISTKLRVVFDASAKGTNGISLNDVLLPGPKLHQDLRSILLKFRLFPIVFICDIKQMYCQILIDPSHRNFQRFLWRSSSKHVIKEYTLNRVTFGVSSAPYLALRTLRQLALLEQGEYPLAANILLNSVYVDDCVVGADTIESALELKAQLISLLKKGGFELGKWASNSPEILSAVDPSVNVQATLPFDKEEQNVIKVLGLHWNPNSDSFSYICTPMDLPCTKRNVLSQLARIFDPLGFLSPVTFLAKHLLQQLWLSGEGWDDRPSDSIVEVWNCFKQELHQISKIQINRLILPKSTYQLEIHGFCDASTRGYGCVIYFRITIPHSQPQIYLIAGKSKVAPLKTVCLPRLELCAAHLLANLYRFVVDSYKENLSNFATFLWSDSQVALNWIANSPHRWKTFIANRVALIQEITSVVWWKYIPTTDNPADCCSRGLTPSKILDHNLWWEGPAFLKLPPGNWPEQPSITHSASEALSEEKVVNVFLIATDGSFINDILSRYSSLSKIQRILSYVVIFIMRAKKNLAVCPRISSLDDSALALMIIIKHVQHQEFSAVIEACSSNSRTPKPFHKLAPFIDDAGLLRVGGRLRNSELAFDAKFPILLPKTHRLTDLIVEQVHRDKFHPGLKGLHNFLLQNFWILSPRSAIRRCISRCIRCFRLKPRSYAPFMADLPAFRVSQLKAFSHVCLDYAGPFLITMSKHRGVKASKAYVCIFVCGSTKAVHLEVASDLTTDAFLASFRRFAARRGTPSDLYSDQGTNFRGAYTQLKEFAKQASEKLCIKWHFNPPGAPHFNGLSEAGVKSVKTHLSRVTGEQILTYEEFYTLLTQIEAILNSRPLTPISEDPNDLSPLTPGHFLTLAPLSSFPEADYSHLKINRLSRWQLIQRMQADFWKRWSEEYLHTLHQRGKWTNSQENVELNTLALIKNEQTPPRQWMLGRVTCLHPGSDGIVRVVTLKVANGFIQRPVVKLCPLPGQ